MTEWLQSMLYRNVVAHGISFGHRKTLLDMINQLARTEGRLTIILLALPDMYDVQTFPREETLASRKDICPHPRRSPGFGSWAMRSKPTEPVFPRIGIAVHTDKRYYSERDTRIGNIS